MLFVVYCSALVLVRQITNIRQQGQAPACYHCIAKYTKNTSISWFAFIFKLSKEEADMQKKPGLGMKRAHREQTFQKRLSQLPWKKDKSIYFVIALCSICSSGEGTQTSIYSVVARGCVHIMLTVQLCWTTLKATVQVTHIYKSVYRATCLLLPLACHVAIQLLFPRFQ